MKKIKSEKNNLKLKNVGIDTVQEYSISNLLTNSLRRKENKTLLYTPLHTAQKSVFFYLPFFLYFARKERGKMNQL